MTSSAYNNKFRFHDHALGFDKGRVILLNIPYALMALPFYLLLCLINGLTLELQLLEMVIAVSCVCV